MRDAFDRRVLSDGALELVRACQRRVPCHLGGGAALAGAFLAHRLSRDIDLFCHEPNQHRELVRELHAVAMEAGASIQLQRDGGSFVRATVSWPDRSMLLDVVYEPQPDIDPPPAPIESIVVESLTDLRASKLTCILSRSEPRDLVDLLFLERAGYRPEADLEIALKKDAGIDPGILAWLLHRFPVEPLPDMLVPLSVAELQRYRDDVAERMRRISVG